MKRCLSLLLAAACALSASAATRQPPAAALVKANPLPLALDDAYQFRKMSIFVNDPRLQKPTSSEMIGFIRSAVAFGAITIQDQAERFGAYYDIYWRSKRPSDLTIRFEYRQDKLGSYVEAKELFYKAALGTIHTKFDVVGDDYTQNGRVMSWRALLIQNGKIVALNQSFLWD